MKDAKRAKVTSSACVGSEADGIAALAVREHDELQLFGLVAAFDGPDLVQASGHEPAEAIDDELWFFIQRLTIDDFEFSAAVQLLQISLQTRDRVSLQRR